MRIIKSIILIFLLFIYSSYENIVLAQSVNLGIYPPILQIMIKPGKSLTQVYKVYNQGDPVIVTSSIKPFSPSDSNGNINLVDCANLAVLGCESLTWINFQNADLKMGQSFFMGSDREQEVVLKISVPEYATEGDYYNTLLFTTQAPPGVGDSKTRASAAIGSNILITVSKEGNPTRNIQISQFLAQKEINILGFKFKLPLFDSFDLIPIYISVQNLGNAYDNVKGDIQLSGFPGLQSTFIIPATNILAGTTRTLYATPSAQVNLTQNKQTPSLVLFNGFYIGRYKLNLNLTGENDKRVQKDLYFYALPYKAFSVLAVFIVIVLILRKAVKRKK